MSTLFRYLSTEDSIRANGDRHKANGDRYMADGKPEYAAGSYRKAERNYRLAESISFPLLDGMMRVAMSRMVADISANIWGKGSADR